MTINTEAILDNLAPFTDLGTDAPLITQSGKNLVARLTRNGFLVELIFLSEGVVIEKHDGVERRHANLRALLASPNFADLGKWADSQKLLLRDRVSKETIPVFGQFSANNMIGDIETFDDCLVNLINRSSMGTSIILIDGPAGIGKTSLIRSLCFRRADQYRRTRRPLVLHVESRGRMLQNITDLMAFSLQSLRLTVMYDQIPVLVRNGLITLAIDGFDELGDPNGYELAWAQVNDLIESSRGDGCIVLSGRETFIGKERIKTALNSIDLKNDSLETFSLCHLRPSVAKSWLEKSGWKDEISESDMISPLFEEGSYALRPFFLTELAREGVAEQIETGQLVDLLSFLIDAMIEREAGKFGRDIDAVTTDNERRNFIRRIMEEVARDLAENQSDAIGSDTLSWLAEMVATETIQPGLIGILRNRVGVIAFLTDDDRRGYRRFVHEQVLNYFLSHVTVKAICSGEIPKYVRRNIFGLEFLENFSGVVRYLDTPTIDAFVLSAVEQINLLGDQDRSRRNLSALVLAVCSVSVPSQIPIISNVSIDEVYLSESVSRTILKNVTIGQIYARSVDLQEITFEGDCHIVTLIADDATVPSSTLPLPSLISLPRETLSDPTLSRRWLFRREILSRRESLYKDIMDVIKNFGLFDLLSRVARYKPFWLRDGDEKAARKILDDPHWEKLKELMIKHDFLIQRDRAPASGRPAPFYHIKNRQSLLLLDTHQKAMEPFLKDVITESLRLEGLLDE